MKDKIVDLIISELLEHIEEIKRLEIADRVTYIGFLIEEISGVPAIYLPVETADKIIKILGREVNLSKNTFS